MTLIPLVMYLTENEPRPWVWAACITIDVVLVPWIMHHFGML